VLFPGGLGALQKNGTRSLFGSKAAIGRASDALALQGTEFATAMRLQCAGCPYDLPLAWHFSAFADMTGVIIDHLAAMQTSC